MLAARLGHFDREALARTTSYVDQVTLPDDSELVDPLADFRELFARPAQQAQWARLQSALVHINTARADRPGDTRFHDRMSMTSGAG